MEWVIFFTLLSYGGLRGLLIWALEQETQRRYPLSGFTTEELDALRRQARLAIFRATSRSISEKVDWKNEGF